MVNQDLPHDTRAAIDFKEQGNKYFKSGDYTRAEMFYTKAINCDPQNPVLYTNRAMVLLKLSLHHRVIEDAQCALRLLPSNMKAYFQLAQAQLALNYYDEAFQSAKTARKFCMEEMYAGTKGANSIEPITELVMKCKKMGWEAQESKREMNRSKLSHELQYGLEERRDKKIAELRNSGHGNEEKIKETMDEYQGLIEEFKRTWGIATGEKKREVPDWCIDDISFSVMLDPVITKTGQSYDKASILEHLKRSETDPLTREPLYPRDLRPNFALRDACEEFLRENGWAADW
ncbi:E3 ubiquitin-protein ligase CHIP [Erysiphe necator]|nr:E3 ubiquitin-protein ligase CHIP [Erysiphe necator]